MNARPGSAATRGVLAGVSCYLLWGLLPLYWQLLASVDATELIAHRLFWTMLFLVPVLWWRGGLKETYLACRSLRSFGLSLLSGTLLTANWLVFVWAVNNGHVMESSLGYFLVPLVNVAVGWGVLHERLRRLQWIAIALAAAGVAWQVWQIGRLPWIALIIAGTFGTYALLRKQSSLGSLAGLTVETTLLAPVAAAFLLWRAQAGTGALGHAAPEIQWTILTTGVVTAGPLLLFAYGARRLQLTTIGLLQYLAPTVQFALGIWHFHEPFSAARAQSFILIWTGLTIYTVDALWTQRRRRVVPL